MTRYCRNLGKDVNKKTYPEKSLFGPNGNFLTTHHKMSILSSNKKLGHEDRELSLKFREGKMGRTVMPYSQVMESERERLKPFRRTLSKEDQQAFDRLFDRAKTGAGVRQL
jgi:hypothetical protein